MRKFVQLLCLVPVLIGCASTSPPATAPSPPPAAQERPAPVTPGGGKTEVTIPPGFKALSLSSDGKRLIGLQDGELVLLDTTSKQQQKLAPADGEVAAVWFADVGQVLVEVGKPTAKELVATSTTAAPAKRLQISVETLGQGPEIVTITSDGDRRIPVVTEELLAESDPTVAELVRANDLRVFWVGFSRQGDRVIATFKAAGPSPRFGIASVATDVSDPKVWILPLYADHPANEGHSPRRPCHTASPLRAEQRQRLIVPMFGPGCENQVAILDSETLEQVELITVPPKAELDLSPDGDWVIITPEAGEPTLHPLVPGADAEAAKAAGRALGWWKGK